MSVEPTPDHACRAFPVTAPERPGPQITDEDVQAIAVALRKRWGPCDHHECADEDDMCHVPMVRDVLTAAVDHRRSQPPLFEIPADALDEAWNVICAYADLPPANGPTNQMLVSRTHLETALARATPLLVARAIAEQATTGPDVAALIEEWAAREYLTVAGYRVELRPADISALRLAARRDAARAVADELERIAEQDYLQIRRVDDGSYGVVLGPDGLRQIAAEWREGKR